MEGFSEDDDDFVRADLNKQMQFKTPVGKSAEVGGNRLENCMCQDPKVQTSFSIGSVLRILSKFGDEKIGLVKSMGFGALLSLKSQIIIPRLLVLWLVRNIDTEEKTVNLPSGERLTFQEIDVNLVIGIPHTGNNVVNRSALSQREQIRLRTILMVRAEDEVTVKLLESVLLREFNRAMNNAEQDAFKVALLLYIDAYFLAPKGSTVRINTEIFSNIAETWMIPNLNWSGYVLKVLMQSAKKVQRSLVARNKTATLDGCLIFWVIFYLDNIDFGLLENNRHVLPRIKKYDYDTVKNLCRLDRTSSSARGGISFGANKLKSRRLVVYSRNDRRDHCQQESEREEEDRLQYAVEALINCMERVKVTTEETKMQLLDAINARRANNSMTMNQYNRQDEDTIGATPDETWKTTRRFICKTRNESTARKQNCAHEQSDAKSNLIEISSDSSVQSDSGGEFGVESSFGAGDMHITIDSLSSKHKICRSDFDINKGDGRSDSSDNDRLYFDTMEPNAQVEQGSDNINEGSNLFSNAVVSKGKEPDKGWCEVETSEDYAIGAVARSDSAVKKGMVEGHISEDTNGAAPCIDFGPDDVDDFCPTPICIVMQDEGEFVEECNMTEMIDHNVETELNRHERKQGFGLSPFVLNMTHKDSDLDCIFAIQRATLNMNGQERALEWYVHDNPSVIKLRGIDFELAIKNCEDFSIELMDGLIRLYQQMDDEMYRLWNEKRWRHFLPTDFAIAALNPDISIGSDSVENLFLGPHVSYYVADCRLVFATLMVRWHWCLYAWDFQRKKIIVLDPISMAEGSNLLQHKHSSTVELMHEAMVYCKNNYFPSAQNNMTGWTTEYYQIEKGSVQSNDSGVYTMFCARYFDGEVLTRILTKESTRTQRANMACQLLNMKGNKASAPSTVQQVMWGE